MRWSDERYVRLYTRDTIAWRMLPWQARALWPLVLRKLDRAGLMPLEGHGAAGLAALVDLPAEVVEVGYPSLLSDGCLSEIDGVLVCPNFIEAQEAAQSDPQRAREKRARDREIAAAQNMAVTKRDATVASGNVTSRPVTSCHSVPSRAVPYLAEKTSPAREDRVDAAPDRSAYADAWFEAVRMVGAPTPLRDLVEAIEEQARRETPPADPLPLFRSVVAAFTRWVDACPARKRPQKSPAKALEHLPRLLEIASGKREAAPPEDEPEKLDLPCFRPLLPLPPST